MCVYSVLAKDQRDAVIGEGLVVTPFPHSQGMADPANRDIAVCIRPGSSVMFRGLDAETRKSLGLRSSESEAVLEARGEDEAREDIFVFGNGAQISIHDLPPGTYLEVLSIGPRQDVVLETQPAEEVVPA